jgi:hypothetical protein
MSPRHRDVTTNLKGPSAEAIWGDTQSHRYLFAAAGRSLRHAPDQHAVQYGARIFRMRPYDWRLRAVCTGWGALLRYRGVRSRRKSCHNGRWRKSDHKDAGWRQVELSVHGGEPVASNWREMTGQLVLRTGCFVLLRRPNYGKQSSSEPDVAVDQFISARSARNAMICFCRTTRRKTLAQASVIIRLSAASIQVDDRAEYFLSARERNRRKRTYIPDPRAAILYSYRGSTRVIFRWPKLL